MILISTNYDDVTVVLAGYANDLHQSNRGNIRQAVLTASATDIHAVLAAQMDGLRFVCFFGHGLPASPLDQGHLPAMTPTDWRKYDRVDVTVYGACCWSASWKNLLTYAAVIGFEGILWVPYPQFPKYVKGMMDCMLAAPRAMLRGDTAAEAAERARKAFHGYARKLLRSKSVQDRAFAISYVMPNERAIRPV